jgi:hypothetical protein
LPLTFWVDEMLVPAVERTKVASPLVGNYYRVNAEVIYISQDLNQAGCILDFGMQAISELGGLLGVPLPSDCKEGDYVTGKIRLDLALCTVVHPHDLTRKWRVNEISADLTDYSSKPGDISGPLDPATKRFQVPMAFGRGLMFSTVPVSNHDPTVRSKHRAWRILRGCLPTWYLA